MNKEVSILITAIDRPELHTRVLKDYLSYIGDVKCDWHITINNVVGQVNETKKNFETILKGHDLKIFTSEFNTNNDSNGAQLVGPIFLNSRVATCPANGTTLVALYNLSHSGLFYESNYSSIHAIDTVDNSMNFIQAFVANSGDNTFTAQAYTDIDPSNQSLDQIGVVTSFIDNIGSDPHMYVTFKNNSSNPVKVKSKNVGFGTVGLANEIYRFKAQNQSDGSERTSIYAGITSTNTGISTFLDLNSQLFDTVKSLVEVSIGAPTVTVTNE